MDLGGLVPAALAVLTRMCCLWWCASRKHAKSFREAWTSPASTPSYQVQPSSPLLVRHYGRWRGYLCLSLSIFVYLWRDGWCG